MENAAPSLVSIVIPCYNAGPELNDAIASALEQTHPAIEIVVVDDGSTRPETLELLRNPQWPRTRIFHKENGGPATARNLAISHARGRYILPLDADDHIDPTYVEKAVALMDAQEDIGIVYCKALKFGAENGLWQLPAYTLREIVIDNVIFVTSLFRRDDWTRVGGFSESLRLGIEDYDFWVKIVALGRQVRQLDEALFHYRVGHVSRTTGFQQDRGAVVKTYADIFRNNLAFYGQHAEYLFEHRFGLYDELLKYRARYGRVEQLFVRHPWIERLARFTYQILFRRR